MIADAQKARAEKYLNSLINYKGKVITVKEWLKALNDDGYIPTITEMHDSAKEEKEKERLRRLLNSWDLPIGNENHPRTIKYFEDKAQLEKGIFKIVYSMSKDNLSYTINKTAYDYMTSTK